MVMERQNLQKIEQHLSDETVQERLRQNILRVHDEATVTIGRAARLFGFSESQLRDWEKSGLLKSQRSKELLENKNNSGNRHGGQRQYSFAELDKLAVIHELINELRLSPGSIPTNIDTIWNKITAQETRDPQISIRSSTGKLTGGVQSENIAIDSRVETIYAHQQWRYYTSRALWLCLMLLHEDVPGLMAGLILPYHELNSEQYPEETECLPQIGLSLVGWLGQTRSFYTFITKKPAFEYNSDYTVLQLLSEKMRKEGPVSPASRTLIVAQRKEVRQVSHNEETIQTVLRLLTPIYEDRNLWLEHLGEETGGYQINPSIDFTAKVNDDILTAMANMVIRLGGKNSEGKDRWTYCNILLPEKTQLPVQQQQLIVRAKSRHSPMQVSKTLLLPERYTTSVSLRAFWGGHIVSRPFLTADDTSGHLEKNEGPVRSNIAIPMEGEGGQALGALYVASYETYAFHKEDQRILRIITRMIAELVETYNTRQRFSSKLFDIQTNPGTVDPLFQDFSSEIDFFEDVEDALKNIRSATSKTYQEEEEEATTEMAFIAIDLDSDVQERIAHNYGDQIVRQLNKEFGLRIRGFLPALVSHAQNRKLYHIYAGRYYLFLRNFSLEKAQAGAERIRKSLTGNITIKRSESSNSGLVLPGIKLHLGVTHYPIEKLETLLQEKTEINIKNCSTTMYNTLDSILLLGSDQGDITMTWDPEIFAYRAYTLQP